MGYTVDHSLSDQPVESSGMGQKSSAQCQVTEDARCKESSRIGRFVFSATLIVVAVLMGGCGQSEPGEPASAQPPFKPVVSLHEVMHDVIFPSAEVVWESVGTIISYEGTEEIYPRSEEEWVAVQSSATILTEAGNLLMMEGRAKDSGPWMERARELIDAGEIALKAAEAQDTKAVFDSGERIYNACNDCHIQYRFIHDDPSTIRP